jgi:hypothetical protein
MGRTSPLAKGKRQREQVKADKRRAKDAKRAARKAAKTPGTEPVG